MSLKHIVGLDHVVVAVRDLDAAAAAWNRIGFTLSPRGTHSAHLGSANYTIVFGEDYIELLGILNETEHNQPTTAFLKEREGVERTAFTTDDAAAGVEELKARGLAGQGPISFSRPVDLPDGSKSAAKFNVFTWPLNEAPGGLRIFACQHLTPDAVWIPALRHHPNGATRLAAVEIPELKTHANGAQGLVQVEVLSSAPQQVADQLARLIDQKAEAVEGGFRVASGGNRASFVFYDAAGFAARYPESVRKGSPAEGAVAIMIRTDDLAKARPLPGAQAFGNQVSIPADQANGVIVSFTAS